MVFGYHAHGYAKIYPAGLALNYGNVTARAWPAAYQLVHSRWFLFAVTRAAKVRIPCDRGPIEAGPEDKPRTQPYVCSRTFYDNHRGLYSRHRCCPIDRTGDGRFALDLFLSPAPPAGLLTARETGWPMELGSFSLVPEPPPRASRARSDKLVDYVALNRLTDHLPANAIQHPQCGALLELFLR